MNDDRDPETENHIRRALAARAEEITVSPDALDSIRHRRNPRSARPAAYGAVAAALVLIAGIAFLNQSDDEPEHLDTATTTSTAPPSTTTTLDDDATTSTTTVPDPSAGDQFAIWPLVGPGEASADAAARGWVENVLGLSADGLRPVQSGQDAVEDFVLPFVGEGGEPLGVDGLLIAVRSPDGAQWFVERVETPGVRVDLVERNGATAGLRVSGFGNAFEGTGLLWVDEAGPTIVGLGADDTGDEFSVVVPWDGTGPVRIRLETGTAVEGAVPAVHAFATDPVSTSTDIRVFRVADDDVLNVRTAAGVGNDIAFTLAPTADGITQTGEIEQVGGEEWWEIIGPDGDKGWANARFLSVQREVVTGSPVAEAMIDQAQRFLAHLGPTIDIDPPDPHRHGTDIGGIGVFADAPSPFTTVDDVTSDGELDWNPFPGEAGVCDDLCNLTVREFLAVRARDVAEAQYTIGPDPEAIATLQYSTGLVEDYYARTATVVAYVPAESDEVLDWRRYTFAFDFVDGSPTISQVWRWGWTP